MCILCKRPDIYSLLVPPCCEPLSLIKAISPPLGAEQGAACGGALRRGEPSAARARSGSDMGLVGSGRLARLPARDYELREMNDTIAGCYILSFQGGKEEGRPACAEMAEEVAVGGRGGR